MTCRGMSRSVEFHLETGKSELVSPKFRNEEARGESLQELEGVGPLVLEELHAQVIEHIQVKGKRWRVQGGTLIKENEKEEKGRK